MKINMIVPGVNHSGGIQVAWEYLNYFADQGADIVCYTPMKSLIKTGINFDSLGKWFKKNFKVRFVPFINNLTVRDADICIATGWITSYWLESLSPAKGKKVYFIQDYETWFTPEKNKLVEKSYHLAMDSRISVSTALQKKLLDLDQCNSKVICNGIHAKYLKLNYKPNNINNNLLVIGMPYREKKGTSDIKNCEFGIEVVKKILEQYSNVKFKMYGFKKPEKLSKNIEFLEDPSREELLRWYDSIDILYVPSIYEGWGLPAMEGMARGCVVVSSNTGCLKEFGKNKINCIKLDNMRSMDEAYSVFQALISNKKLRTEIGISALSTVKNYTFENSARKFWNELNNVVFSDKNN